MRKTATNQFGDGLVTDFHPLTAKNTTLVDALNATLVTAKGNEMILQNDAGNIQIKTGEVNDKGEPKYVQLTKGFIPIGIKEYNGVLYIVSYDPDSKNGEIGSYPGFDTGAKYYQHTEVINDPLYPPPIYKTVYYKLVSQTSKKVNDYRPFYNFLSPVEDSDDNIDDIKYGGNVVEISSEEELPENSHLIYTTKKFSTTKFNFDLGHPVSIEIQPSYDGSVNLILTDDKNPPRLINSGFRVLENGEFSQPNRNNNRENIYTENDFDLQTSLIKRTDYFPVVEYNGVLNNGNLKVGNYTLYFKYADDDGNETDFIAWSNMISIFKGFDKDPFSIDGGVEDMNAHKSISVTLTKLDKAYRYIKVYYSRTSSAIDSNRIPQAYSIDKNFQYENDSCNIVITGEENITQIPLSELNTQYFVANTAKTQAQCQNILFLGNSTTTEVNYTDLINLSLYIKPQAIRTESNILIGRVSSETYRDTSEVPEDQKYEYYNTKNIYKYVGYWNEEYYRLGIVYILKDNTKTPVFNILGGTFEKFDENNIAQLTTPSETSYLNPEELNPENCHVEDIELKDNYYIDNGHLLNNQGVVHFNDEDFIIKNEAQVNEEVTDETQVTLNTNEYVYGIKINIPKNVQIILDRLGIKGYFIVRQKRIPTIVAQGYTLPWDKEAKIPIVTYFGKRIDTLDSNPYDGQVKEGDIPNDYDTKYLTCPKRRYFVESFLNQIGNEEDKGENNSDTRRLVSNDYHLHLHYIMDWAIDTKMVEMSVDGEFAALDKSFNFTTYCRYVNTDYLNNLRDSLNNNPSDSDVTQMKGDFFDKTTTNLGNLGNLVTLSPNITLLWLEPTNDSSISDQDWVARIKNTNNTLATFTYNSNATYQYKYSGTITLTDNKGQQTTTDLSNIDTKESFVSEVNQQLLNVDDTIKHISILAKIALVSTSSGETTEIYSRQSTIYDGDRINQLPSDLSSSTVEVSRVGGYIADSKNYKINEPGKIEISEADDYSFVKSGPRNAINGGGYFLNRKFKDDNVAVHVVQHYYNLYKYCDGKQMTAICPEFEVRQDYYNSLFTGNKFKVKYTKYQPGYLVNSKDNKRFFYNDIKTNVDKTGFGEREFNIVSVTDNVPVVAINNTIFKSVIGSEAEAYRFSYINEEHCHSRDRNYKGDKSRNAKDEDDFNLVRGIYSPYLGIVSSEEEFVNSKHNSCKLFNIYYPENADEFQVRFENTSAYYPITSSTKIDVNNDAIYNGDCFLCTFTHRVNRNFNDPVAPTNDHILDSKTWQKNYYPDTTATDTKKEGIERLNQINRGDVNAVKLGSWITIRVKASYNLSIRSLDESHIQEKGIMGRARGFYPLQQASADGGFKIPNSYVINDAFGATTGEQYYTPIIDAPYINTDYSTRIAYSDIDVTGNFKNGYRIFRGQHYRDYTKQYGAITKLIELQSNLLCVFEHGVALIPVNERALAAEGSGGEVYINNSNVLPETPKVLSDMYGSQWAESVVKTPYYIYGIDAARKKIWKTNGVQFEIISDFRVEQFLINNLTLPENDILPCLAIKNIASHYNANKSDVIFTFYTRPFEWKDVTDKCGKIIGHKPILSTEIQDELAWSICYNEILQKFETFYSWIPLVSANIDNEFYSFDRECSREILLNQEQADYEGTNQRKDETGYHRPITVPYLWKHGSIGTDRPKPTYWYGEQHPFEFEFIVNAEAGVQKVFDNLRLIANSAEPESFHFTIEGDNYDFSNDKLNMFFRQEATKELFQSLGSHISYNEEYAKLTPKQNVKSTIFPLYYNRVKVFNDIYDHYTQMLDKSQSRNYCELSGSEITWDQSLGQFFITTHIKNNIIDDSEIGYLRGNSRYLEGQWQIQVPTITLMQKNEDNYWNKDVNWKNGKPPIVINPYIMVNDLSKFTIEKTGLPNTYSLGDIDTTKWTFRQETKIRDKYCKIRIRYSGEKLAVISAVITTFTLSYA